MSDQFNYKLVTPEKIYLEGDAQMVVLPGAEGDLGVLPNHSNIITSLRPGIIKVTNSDQTQSFNTGIALCLRVLTCVLTP